MTDSKGAPVRSYGGDKYEQKVAESDYVTLIAQRLTMKIYLSRSGNDMAGFNRPMNYRPLRPGVMGPAAQIHLQTLRRRGPIHGNSAIVFSNSHQTSKSTEGRKSITGRHYDDQERRYPAAVGYLEQAAKERGISRTKLVRIVMEKVIRDELVSEIVSEDELAADTPQPRYRRFREQ